MKTISLKKQLALARGKKAQETRLVNNLVKAIITNDPTVLYNASILWVCEFSNYLPENFPRRWMGEKDWKEAVARFHSYFQVSWNLFYLFRDDRYFVERLHQFNHSLTIWKFEEFEKSYREGCTKFRNDMRIVNLVRKKLKVWSYRVKYLHGRVKSVYDWRSWKSGATFVTKWTRQTEFIHQFTPQSALKEITDRWKRSKDVVLKIKSLKQRFPLRDVFAPLTNINPKLIPLLDGSQDNQLNEQKPKKTSP